MGRSEHSNKTRDVISRLKREGWFIKRTGPGDHIQFSHLSIVGNVTVDSGVKEIPTGTLRSIYRQAKWEW